jgi:hypothetical protein
MHYFCQKWATLQFGIFFSKTHLVTLVTLISQSIIMRLGASIFVNLENMLITFPDVNQKEAQSQIFR